MGLETDELSDGEFEAWFTEFGINFRFVDISHLLLALKLLKEEPARSGCEKLVSKQTEDSTIIRISFFIK